MPPYSARGPFLKPSCHERNPAQGDMFFVLKNKSKSHLIPTLRLTLQAPYTPLPVNGKDPCYNDLATPKRGRLYRIAGLSPSGSGCVVSLEGEPPVWLATGETNRSVTGFYLLLMPRRRARVFLPVALNP